MMSLGRELALVYMALAAARAPEKHWDGELRYLDLARITVAQYRASGRDIPG